MKGLFFVLLAVASHAGGIEGTVWYDSKGEVAWVDGPAAEKKTPASIIPPWVAREERRDRALRGGYRPRGNASCGSPTWGYWSGLRPIYRSSPHCRPYPPSSMFSTRLSGGVRVIIR